MDKSWIDLPNRIREFVRERLILNGFLKQYKNWIRHGEEYVSCRREERDEIKVDDMSEADPMIVMLNDIACGLAPEYTSCETEGAGGSNPGSSADEEALRYFEILDGAQTKLYHRSKDFSKLSFIVELLHLKALNQWNENAHLDTCIVCQTSRWKEDGVGYNRQNSSTNVVNRGKCVAAKQVRYFPLKPRLKRLFMSSKISKLMRWHAENSRDDGNASCYRESNSSVPLSVISRMVQESRV
ncbi:hypothetical protein AAC387_Pa12g1217 [Persea americana]